ncbi:MAG: F0F1 ATP synthase subunit epsilon [Gammaproteobacteria bacterium]|nr:F0F1 ATP synthase subunit epsilon [Gammaproteobacteria bacterium]
MSKTIQVEIVSSEESIFSGSCEMVSLVGVLGAMSILPGHAPLLSLLVPGAVRLQISGEEEYCYISGGILEVQPHMVIVLADTAIRAHDLDEAKALEAKGEAKKMMAERGAEFDYSLVESQLAQAAAQLHTLQRLRKKLKKKS